VSEDVNKILGADGAGQMVRVGGKEWHILPPNDDCWALFQAWLESEARRTLVAGKEDLGDEYGFAMDRMLTQIASGHYARGKEAFRDAMASPEGGLRLLAILMRQKHSSLTDAQVRKLVESDPEQFKLAFKSAIEARLPKEPGPREDGS
jgi:hypothetical protein